LTGLFSLTIGNNSLTGTIPTEIGLITSLMFLLLNDNSISGSIPIEIFNLTFIQKVSLYNTSINHDSIPSSLFPIIAEPCMICNGKGSYDYIKSIDENVNRLADECAELINDLDNVDSFKMSTVDECNLLTERCVVCHKDNNKSDTGNSNKTSRINNKTENLRN